MTTHDIAVALKTAHTDNLVANWPLIEAALSELHVTSPLAKIAAIATVNVECPTWTPRTEQYNGDPAVFFRKYDGRLGNTQPGDGLRFRGRGYVQITGRANYAEYGKLLGTDFVSDPDKTLQPNEAACVFAAFFYTRRIAEAADREDWGQVRRLVNGGTNGLSDLLKYVAALKCISPCSTKV